MFDIEWSLIVKVMIFIERDVCNWDIIVLSIYHLYRLHNSREESYFLELDEMFVGLNFENIIIYFI